MGTVSYPRLNNPFSHPRLLCLYTVRKMQLLVDIWTPWPPLSSLRLLWIFLESHPIAFHLWSNLTLIRQVERWYLYVRMAPFPLSCSFHSPITRRRPWDGWYRYSNLFSSIKLPADLHESVHREASQPRREPEVHDYHMRRRSTLCL